MSLQAQTDLIQSGKLGMKWGVRKGSSSTSGIHKKYGLKKVRSIKKIEKQSPQERKIQKYKKIKPGKLTDSQLKELTDRIQREAQYKSFKNTATNPDTRMRIEKYADTTSKVIGSATAVLTFAALIKTGTAAVKAAT